MQQSSNPAKPTMSPPGPAFAGLGHDLDGVRLAAAALTLCPVRTGISAPRPRARKPHVPAASGYGLLVALGREIRGR